MWFSIGMVLIVAVVGVLAWRPLDRKTRLACAGLALAAVGVLVVPWIEAREAREREQVRRDTCDNIADQLHAATIEVKSGLLDLHPSSREKMNDKWFGVVSMANATMRMCGTPPDSCWKIPAMLSLNEPDFEAQINIVANAIRTGQPCPPIKK